MDFKAEIMDESAVQRALVRISHEIIEKNKGTDNLVLLGIKTRGVPLAQTISANIEKIENVKLAVGDKAEVHFFGRTGGIVPTPKEILNKIIELGGAK